MINRIDRVSVTHTQDTPRISVDIDHLGSRAWLETFTFFTDIAQSLPAIVLFLGLQLCMPSMYCTSPSYLPLSTFPSPPSFFLFLSFSFSFFPVSLSTFSFPITIIFYLFNAHQNFNPKSCYALGKIPKKKKKKFKRIDECENFEHTTWWFTIILFHLFHGWYK